MALFSDHNLYPGINAHLNSFLQQPDGGWETFHSTHLGTLWATIDKELPENYYSIVEKSLQVFAFETEEDDYLNAVIIYEFEPGKLPGNPVTRIELLSPSNKPPNRDARQYLARRDVTLWAGITLVEIDYLHETRPVIRGIPSYPNGDQDAYPYLISVSRPYPTPEEGYTELYGFGVDDLLPKITIPLVGDDKVIVDFGDVYRQTFESVRVFRMLVDYTQDPLNSDRYHDKDRALVQARLAGLRSEKS